VTTQAPARVPKTPLKPINGRKTIAGIQKNHDPSASEDSRPAKEPESRSRYSAAIARTAIQKNAPPTPLTTAAAKASGSDVARA